MNYSNEKEKEMTVTQPCITCKFFFEYRTPEDRARYGEGMGRCDLIGKADFTWPRVVSRDSTCGEYESLIWKRKTK